MIRNVVEWVKDLYWAYKLRKIQKYATRLFISVDAISKSLNEQERTFIVPALIGTLSMLCDSQKKFETVIDNVIATVSSVKSARGEAGKKYAENAATFFDAPKTMQ